MSLDILHNDVSTICDEEFGIAVSLATLNRILASEINQLAKSNFSLPTRFSDLEASVEINPAKVKILPNAKEARLDVNAEFDVIIHLPSGKSEWLGRYTLSFMDAQSLILEDSRIGGKLGIALQSQGNYVMNPTTRPPEFNDRLIAQGIVDSDGNADTASYDRFESAAFLFGSEIYLDAVLSSIPFPEIRESLRAIKLISPLKVDFSSSHVVIHSPNVEFDNPTCPNSAFKGTEVIFNRITGSDGATVTNVIIKENLTQSIGNQALPHVQTEEVSGTLDAAILYYYPKKILFDWSFGVLKPSVTASDRGTKFGIYWFYNVSAALKPLVVSFQAISPTKGTITIDAPFEVNGNSGAGIKIGCVKHEVLSVRCNGAVDPLVIEVDGGISSNQGSLYINGSLMNMKVDIDWRTNFGFPFDQIADWILDRILNKEIKKVIGRQVNLYRRNISEISDVLKDNQLYVSRIDSNAKGKSILFAANLNEG
ncbi:hypothetical protein AB6E21_22910 [Photobacterium swingsii]|uniref:hypothetical protein n=1 Tax=Photobacterium swingsii TaxID=680026 RepID=UPI00355228AF